MSRVMLYFLLGMAALTVVSGAMVLTFQRRSPYTHSRIGGAFTMADTTGKTVTEKDLRGKPTVMFFGFTSCPDVCPTTLLTLSDVMTQMGPKADQLNVIFVTIDPQRDTAAAMKLYLSSFDPRIRGFTGTDQQVAAMANTYHIAFRRVPVSGTDYTMDHFAGVLLFDKEGRLAGEAPYGEQPAKILAKLQTLVRPAACIPGAPAPVDLWSGAKMKDLCQSG